MSDNQICSIVYLANAINILRKGSSWSSFPVFDFLNAKRRRRRVRIAELDKVDNKREASAMQIIIRPMEERRERR